MFVLNLDKFFLMEINHYHRRRILQFLLAGSLSLPLWFKSSKTAYGSTKVKALVLSCIDYRFVSIEQHFLQQQNLEGQYDWLSLAGASLALSNFPSNAETQTFWEQLELSVNLHDIEKVIILDHQDCGAYATKIDRQLSQDFTKEKEIHRQYLTKAYHLIKQNYPSLQIELYLALLNGETEQISIL